MHDYGYAGMVAPAEDYQPTSPPKYRTKLCRNFPLGACRYGDQCSFLHVPPSASPTAHFSYASAPPILHPSTPSSSRPSPTIDHASGSSHAPRREQRPSRNSMDLWRARMEGACPPPPPGTPMTVTGTFMPLPGSPSTRSDWALAPQECGYGDTEAMPMRAKGAARQGSSPRDTGDRNARHRNTFFKTKPCRFYREPAGCIKGNRCNFIHESPDEDRQHHRPRGLAAPTPLELIDDNEHELEEDSSTPSEPSPCSATTVSSSDSEQDHNHDLEQEQEYSGSSSGSHESTPRKRGQNFFPVTWRVVGGGVMMSGSREICESFMAGHCTDGVDCRFAHPYDTYDEQSYAVPHVEPPPMYSPLSPVSPMSPVVFAYPVMYGPAALSPPLPFALPAAPTECFAKGVPASAPAPLPYGTYAPHRVVDGSTLADRNAYYMQVGPCAHAGMYADYAAGAGAEYGIGVGVGVVMEEGAGAVAARGVVRPVSTPPTPLQGEAPSSVHRLFAAEMP
ncbi:uncharacterized protein BXZ73DRAFT_77709 [Epithele typhae]|uniref:uncharacterized protein n=1 Tax=Epithele typhae TaxID=378194 RepID=UPI0020080A11|nr:uncharacterized protein BXZ73DRAFT_77709 [Epithele typhae]KAH9931685.1 hypothetical protein BXZ73DRAFT_77709 [Epithele typhae]